MRFDDNKGILTGKLSILLGNPTSGGSFNLVSVIEKVARLIIFEGLEI